MSAELLVVETCTFSSTPELDSISITSSIKFDKVKCAGKKAYNTIIVSAVKAGYDTTTGTFIGASTKAKGTLLSFVLKNQTVQVSMPVSSGTGSPYVSTISIDDAGQTKVKAV
jgi:hypothetical protein